MRDMKTIVHRKGLLHVETPLGIVNIYAGLQDRLGRRVERVAMLPNRYTGEPTVRVRDSRFVELKTRKGA